MTRDETPGAGVRAWLGLAVLTLPLLVLALDVSVLYLAAPHLAAGLGADDVELLWILDSYGFMIAGLLVPMGALGDRIGRRRLLMIGSAAFAATSVLAAYAPGPLWLIAARAVLGIAGATLMPSALALISTLFRRPDQRRLAIAVWMTTFSAGVALGPIVGGAILQAFWWGAVFLLAVPVVGVLLVLAPALLPEAADPEPGRMDLVSVALSLATLIPLVWGIKEVSSAGPGVPVAAAVAIGLGAGVAFVRRQRDLASPLVDVVLFARPAFRTALGMLLLGILAVNGVNYLYPQFLQSVLGLPPLVAGLWTLPVASAAIGASMAAPALARRMRPSRVIAAGAVLSTAGFALAAWAGAGGGLPVLVTAAVVIVTGLSPLVVLTTDLVVGAAPPARAGSAAALSETSGELGVGLGVAAAGSTVIASGGLGAGLVAVGVGGAVLALALGVLALRTEASAAA